MAQAQRIWFYIFAAAMAAAVVIAWGDDAERRCKQHYSDIVCHRMLQQ